MLGCPFNHYKAMSVPVRPIVDEKNRRKGLRLVSGRNQLPVRRGVEPRFPVARLDS